MLSCMQLNKELVPEDLMEQDQVSTADDPAHVHDLGNDTEGMEESVIRLATAMTWP